MTTHEHIRASVLGDQIDKRLRQLGLSRREFARRANIGRQTLQEIIHDPNKRISERTFVALDNGLKWEAGASKAFHEGNSQARQTLGDMSTEERITEYLGAILRHLSSMDIEELEREVIMLEEESVTRSRHDNGTSELIHRYVEEMLAAMRHGV